MTRRIYGLQNSSIVFITGKFPRIARVSSYGSSDLTRSRPVMHTMAAIAMLSAQMRQAFEIFFRAGNLHLERVLEGLLESPSFQPETLLILSCYF